MIGLDLISPDTINIIEKSVIPVVAYTIRSYEDMAKVLDTNITQILVDDITKANIYINQYIKSKN